MQQYRQVEPGQPPLKGSAWLALWALTSALLLLQCSRGGDGKQGGSPPSDPPTNVSARSDNSGEVGISWAPTPKATSYSLYWNTTGNVTTADASIPGIGPSSYLHGGLANGTTHYYAVTAVNAKGETVLSSEVCAEPIAAPAGVTASLSSPLLDEVTIDWNPVAGATTYNLYWSGTPGVTKTTGSRIAGVTPPHVHAGLVSGQEYHCVVTALNSVCAGAESSESAEATVDLSAQGILDTTFGGTGWVVHDGAAGGAADDRGYDIALDALGRILVAGDSRNPTDFDMAIWCFQDDGALDTTFGTGGVAIHHNAAGGGGDDGARAMALDGSGRILVAGRSSGVLGGDMTIWRYDPSGMLDTTFGTGGVAVDDRGPGDSALAIALDGSGRIFTTGLSVNASGNTDMTVWCYEPAGVLDSAFGTGGVAIHDSAAGGSGDDRGIGICTDPSDRILVAGYSCDSATRTLLAIWRYDPNGALDTGFGNGGVVLHDSGVGAWGGHWASAITLDGSDRILPAGLFRVAHNEVDMSIWRFEDAGTLDASFGLGGYVTHNDAAGGNFIDAALDVALDSAGRILTAGISYNAGPGDEDMVIWRHDPTGNLDMTFGGVGFVVFDNPAGGWHDSGQAMTLDAHGRVLVAGYTGRVGGPPDLAIWRFR